jgi:hypothetical protein
MYPEINGNERNTLLNVNKDIFENMWEHIRSQSKVWWSLITDDDLNKVEKAPIKFDKYVMIIRVKYGYTRERAREEINRRVTELKTNSFNEIGGREKTR